MTGLDLRPERRDRLAAKLRAALTAAIPDSRAELRGSLACGTADPYSDIDLAWMVPDDKFAAAVESAASAIQSVGTVSSLRRDPGLARSDRQLIFVRLAGVPLFWRVDVEIRAASVAADNAYDGANPADRSEAGWSRPASAIENAAAAIKAAMRGQPCIADGLLSRGYQRIGLDPAPVADLPSKIIRLADSCAALESGLTALAVQVHQVVQTFAWSLSVTPPAVMRKSAYDGEPARSAALRAAPAESRGGAPGVSPAFIPALVFDDRSDMPHAHFER